MKYISLTLFSIIVFTILSSCSCKVPCNDKGVIIGTYYYDGWAGANSSNEKWAANAPKMLTKKMFLDYPDREPLWGWRDDSINIMEKQIDLAYKNGIDFFVFCWYWTGKEGHFDEKSNQILPEHTSLNLFLKAKNRNKVKFSIIICNHGRYKITGLEQWQEAISYLSKHYFHDSQYLRINTRPYVNFFLAEEVAPYISTINKVLVNNGEQELYTLSCNHRNNRFDIQTWYNNTFEEGKEKVAKNYNELLNRTEKAWRNTSSWYLVSPSCLVGWDKRPWFDDESFVYYNNRSSQLFLKHLKAAIDFLYERNYDPKILHIYAWNEIGEGGYLIPTKGDPKGQYLKQVKNVKKYENERYLK